MKNLNIKYSVGVRPIDFNLWQEHIRKEIVKQYEKK